MPNLKLGFRTKKEWPIEQDYTTTINKQQEVNSKGTSTVKIEFFYCRCCFRDTLEVIRENDLPNVRFL